MNSTTIQETISNFNSTSNGFLENSRDFFKYLGIYKDSIARNVNKQNLETLLEGQQNTAIKTDPIDEFAMICQLDDSYFIGGGLNFDEVQVDTLENATKSNNYQSYIILAIKLCPDQKANKSFIANYVRQFSKLFSNIPVMILFQNGDLLTLGISEKRLNQKDSTKEVVSKVILLKDINISKIHSAHKKILEKLCQVNANSFNELHDEWMKILDIKLITDKFYKEVEMKYNNIVNQITIPTQSNTTIENKKDFSLKLLGRLIFCWFLKAKGWVPEVLLSTKSSESTPNYYHTVLEPLFFESLNKNKMIEITQIYCFISQK